MTATSHASAVVLDVDGTIVDSNYQHALSWYRAFRRIGLTLPVWRLHRAIGMGGDRLVAAVAGTDVEAAHGDEVRAAHDEEFERMLPEVAPLPGAAELLVAVVDAGYRLALASSGTARHVEHYLDLLDARRLTAVWTTSDDVRRTKPDPELIEVALAKTGGNSAVMIGDSVWDAKAAKALALPAIGIRTGGFSNDELTAAGADAVYESLDDLRAELARLPFGEFRLGEFRVKDNAAR